jgi:hypothetical protein
MTDPLPRPRRRETALTVTAARPATRARVDSRDRVGATSAAPAPTVT